MPAANCSSLEIADPSATTARCRRSSWLRDFLLLAVVSGIWFCGLQGLRPLANPDEGRYTEIPREMAETGDFVTPRLNGVKYFEKPPLLYWLSALTFRQFGVSESTARLWNGLFSVLGVLMTYGTARLLYGRGAGIWAAVVLSTTLMYYAMSQIVLLDMAVAVTVSGALFAFVLGVREPPGRRRMAWFLVLYVFMALATLSKGLIGIALPGAVIFLWVLLLNRWRALWPFYPLVGTILLLAIAAPWHVLAARANADFLWFYFVHEHWLRFTTRIHERYEPWWFFLPVFVVGLFPWVFFAGRAVAESVAGGWKARHQHAEAWFFLIWIVFIVAFFSKSQSKLIPYILPVFPAAAILIGRSLARVWQGLPGKPLHRIGWAFIGTATVLVVAALVAPNPKDQSGICACLPVLRVTLGAAMFGGAAAAFLGLRRRQPRLIIGAVAVTGVALLLSASFGAQDYDKYSTKKFAMILKPMLKAGDRVFSVSYYTQDLPAYLGRTVSVVDDRGEMDFGIRAEPALTSKRFFGRPEFSAQWTQPGTAYAVLRLSTYRGRWFTKLDLPHEVLAQTDSLILIANRRVPSQP